MNEAGSQALQGWMLMTCHTMGACAAGKLVGGC
jgi:hypothetical protein